VFAAQNLLSQGRATLQAPLGHLKPGFARSWIKQSPVLNKFSQRIVPGSCLSGSKSALVPAWPQPTALIKSPTPSRLVARFLLRRRCLIQLAGFRKHQQASTQLPEAETNLLWPASVLRCTAVFEVQHHGWAYVSHR
jgi:hypothetical protein